MGIRASKSLRTKIIILYVIMSLINITILTLIISDNQAGLISDNARLNAKETVGAAVKKIKEYTYGFNEEKSRDTSQISNSIQILDSLLKNVFPVYILSDENGIILHQSLETVPLPAGFADNIRKSVALQEYSGAEYTLVPDKFSTAFHFYYPLEKLGFKNQVLYGVYDLTKIRGKYQKLLTSVIFMVILVVFFHLFMALYIFSKVVNPVTQISKSTRDLAEGKYDTRINLKRNDEIGELANGFNSMAEQISAKIIQLNDMVHMVNNTNIKLEISNFKLDELATKDELTKLYNRRHFYDIIRKETEKFFRYSELFSVIMMDIDFFKKFNDTHGHEAGDYVLKYVANVLKKASRDIDEVARLGGEEFIIMLPKTPAAGAAIVAERIRMFLMQHALALKNGTRLQVTGSFGVCDTTMMPAETMPLQNDSASQSETVQKFMELIIKQADQALYSAKEKGRNRVVIFEPGLNKE